MPHVWKEQCYAALDRQGKACTGDTVYLKSDPSRPMTVSAKDRYNWTADHREGRGPDVTLSWIEDGEMRGAVLPAIALSK